MMAVGSRFLKRAMFGLRVLSRGAFAISETHGSAGIQTKECQNEERGKSCLDRDRDHLEMIIAPFPGA